MQLCVEQLESRDCPSHYNTWVDTYRAMSDTELKTESQRVSVQAQSVVDRTAQLRSHDYSGVSGKALYLYDAAVSVKLHMQHQQVQAQMEALIILGKERFKNP